jgi:hypothetical protein
MKKFKTEIQELIVKEDFLLKLESLDEYNSKRLITTLISLLYNPNPLIKERSILALGYTVSKIADDDIQYARIIMRRLMLSLTEESGGIGWGAPEAMGEIMARNYQLAQEYHQMLISYTPGGGNELEFEHLQKDVIAGLKRLAHKYPNLVEEVKHLL